jgi:leucyl aminopeptidase (aminopeptidase T)
MGESGPGQAWLPAGEVYACIDPKSANGTIVVPSMEFRGKQIKNIILNYTNGKLTSMKAEENGDLLKKSLEMSTGDKDVLSLVDLGINPNSRILKNSTYYSWEMGGMVTLAIGDNTWAGGEVKSGTGFSFHLPNATVSIDNFLVVNNGQLKPF